MAEKYQRTKKYDQNWINANKMGPNPLYLLEELCNKLCNKMNFKKDMKVLDMGCGKAIT